MNVSHEGAVFLVGHSLCHAVGDDFKELRPTAAMWQGDALATEVGSVLNRRSQLALNKDGPLCPQLWMGKKKQPSCCWARTAVGSDLLPRLFVVSRQIFANPLFVLPQVTWRAATAPQDSLRRVVPIAHAWDLDSQALWLSESFIKGGCSCHSQGTVWVNYCDHDHTWQVPSFLYPVLLWLGICGIENSTKSTSTTRKILVSMPCT